MTNDIISEKGQLAGRRVTQDMHLKLRKPEVPRQAGDHDIQSS